MDHMIGGRDPLQTLNLDRLVPVAILRTPVSGPVGPHALVEGEGIGDGPDHQAFEVGTVLLPEEARDACAVRGMPEQIPRQGIEQVAHVLEQAGATVLGDGEITGGADDQVAVRVQQ